MNMHEGWAGLAMALAIVGAVGCDTIHGSGRAVEDERSLEAFDEIEVEAGMEAVLTQGAQRVVVHGDDNIVPSVRTTVHGSILRISPEHDFDPVSPLFVAVSVPVPVSASLRAGGRLDVDDVEVDELAVSVEAGGDLIATGTTDRLHAYLSAGGRVDTSRVSARVVDLHGEAGGEMIVRARERVSGSVESGAEVVVLGGPSSREVSEASGGTVEYR